MRSRRWQWQRQRQRLWLCAASSTFLLFSLVVGASPLYTVCRHTTHTHAHIHMWYVFFCFYFIALYVPHNTHRQRGARHAHACEHAYIQLLHAPVCVCVCVTDAALAESDQTQTKVSSAVAAGWQRAGSGQAARVPLQAATAHYAKAQPNLQTLSRAVSLSLSLFPAVEGSALVVSCAVWSAASRCCLVAGQFRLGFPQIIMICQGIEGETKRNKGTKSVYIRVH